MRTKLDTAKKSMKTSDAIKILDKMMERDSELNRLVEEARVNAVVAQLIYDARNKAGLSQDELAKKVGTTQSVISRLEDADYDGHSLSMLQRIAAALDKKVEVRFSPAKRKLQTA